MQDLRKSMDNYEQKETLMMKQNLFPIEEGVKTVSSDFAAGEGDFSISSINKYDFRDKNVFRNSSNEKKNSLIKSIDNKFENYETQNNDIPPNINMNKGNPKPDSENSPCSNDNYAEVIEQEIFVDSSLVDWIYMDKCQTNNYITNFINADEALISEQMYLDAILKLNAKMSKVEKQIKDNNTALETEKTNLNDISNKKQKIYEETKTFEHIQIEDRETILNLNKQIEQLKQQNESISDPKKFRNSYQNLSKSTDKKLSLTNYVDYNLHSRKDLIDDELEKKMQLTNELMNSNSIRESYEDKLNKLEVVNFYDIQLIDDLNSLRSNNSASNLLIYNNLYEQFEKVFQKEEIVSGKEKDFIKNRQDVQSMRSQTKLQEENLRKTLDDQLDQEAKAKLERENRIENVIKNERDRIENINKNINYTSIYTNKEKTKKNEQSYNNISTKEYGSTEQTMKISAKIQGTERRSLNSEKVSYSRNDLPSVKLYDFSIESNSRKAEGSLNTSQNNIGSPNSNLYVKNKNVTTQRENKADAKNLESKGYFSHNVNSKKAYEPPNNNIYMKKSYGRQQYNSPKNDSNSNTFVYEADPRKTKKPLKSIENFNNQTFEKNKKKLQSSPNFDKDLKSKVVSQRLSEKTDTKTETFSIKKSLVSKMQTPKLNSKIVNTGNYSTNRLEKSNKGKLLDFSSSNLTYKNEKSQDYNVFRKSVKTNSIYNKDKKIVNKSLVLTPNMGVFSPQNSIQNKKLSEKGNECRFSGSSKVKNQYAISLRESLTKNSDRYGKHYKFN